MCSTDVCPVSSPVCGLPLSVLCFLSASLVVFGDGACIVITIVGPARVLENLQVVGDI